MKLWSAFLNHSLASLWESDSHLFRLEYFAWWNTKFVFSALNSVPEENYNSAGWWVLLGEKQTNNSWLALYYTPPNFLIFLSSESIFVLFPPFKWSQRGLLSFSWNAHEHLPYFTIKNSYSGESLSTVCLFSSAQDSGRLIRARFSGCWCSPLHWLMLSSVWKCSGKKWGGTGRDSRTVPLSVLEHWLFQGLHCSWMSFASSPVL